MTATTTTQPQPRLAVLIDAENTRAAYASSIMETIAAWGHATVRRAYGDWTTPQLTPWKKHLAEFAIRPVQQFKHAGGKNSSDCALIIDAMELLHARSVGGFCIVSSDCDFTGLAVRVREAGLRVYGLGLETTNRALVTACDEFAFLDQAEPQAMSNR